MFLAWRQIDEHHGSVQRCTGRPLLPCLRQDNVQECRTLARLAETQSKRPCLLRHNCDTCAQVCAEHLCELVY